MQENIYDFANRSENFNILNLSLTNNKMPLYNITLGGSKDTSIFIEATIYWKSERKMEDVRNSRLFLRVYGKLDNGEILILDDKNSNIPSPAANGAFEISEYISISKEIAEQNKIEFVIIEFSYTQKHDGEMGIGASLEVGTFFRTALPVYEEDHSEVRGI